MLAGLVHEVIGSPGGLGVEAYDGSRAGPTENGAPVLVIVRPDAVSRVVMRPGELGLARAWVAGDIDVRGDLWVAVGELEHLTGGRVPPSAVARLLRYVGPGSLRRQRGVRVLARSDGTLLALFESTMWLQRLEGDHPELVLERLVAEGLAG
jgi:cyclopropane-fatty-acyl-phospholipid synthase